MEEQHPKRSDLEGLLDYPSDEGFENLVQCTSDCQTLLFEMDSTKVVPIVDVVLSVVGVLVLDVAPSRFGYAVQCHTESATDVAEQFW